jgi:FkbM family methyltransferase
LPGSRIFDQPHYELLNQSRGDFVRRVLPSLKRNLQLDTALDVGCGLGHFSNILLNMGFRTQAIDGRAANVEEAIRRYPEAAFSVGDIEDQRVAELGTVDLVFCFGLLYHLENPFRAIRNLKALTGKVLILESMIVPSEAPEMLLRDEASIEDQSLRNVAFYPTEACLVKMLYRAGYGAVYRTTELPDHPAFRQTRRTARSRTVLIGSLQPLALAGVQLCPEPSEVRDPWVRSWFRFEQAARRVAGFLRKPWHQKSQAIGFHWIRMFPQSFYPTRLPFGALWLARGDNYGHAMILGNFEMAEQRFVHNFLKPGMTVLDIGAHHGFYTLLASKAVGPKGRVVSFEPSPREQKELLRHLRLNRCRNVTVEGIALTSQSGEAEYHVVDSEETGCNSLRPPNVGGATHSIVVQTKTLDQCVLERNIASVDFVKLDVEGAELEVLRGSVRLLEQRPRPVMLVEVSELRTKPWEYRAHEILSFLQRAGYRWHKPTKEGQLKPFELNGVNLDCNLVAVPSERGRELSHLISDEGDGNCPPPV